jgi:hypothetical protein
LEVVGGPLPRGFRARDETFPANAVSPRVGALLEEAVCEAPLNGGVDCSACRGGDFAYYRRVGVPSVTEAVANRTGRDRAVGICLEPREGGLAYGLVAGLAAFDRP